MTEGRACGEGGGVVPASGGELLAEIVVEDADMPWLTGRIVAKPGFEEFRPAFQQELALIDAEDDLDYEAWEWAYAPISRLTLASPTGPVPTFCSMSTATRLDSAGATNL
jgi:hypothetical protein